MIFGVCSGPLLGICLLGMLTERVNSTGVCLCIGERERERERERLKVLEKIVRRLADLRDETPKEYTMCTHLSTRAGALAGVITGASAMVYYGVAHLLCPPDSDAVMRCMCMWVAGGGNATRV